MKYFKLHFLVLLNLLLLVQLSFAQNIQYSENFTFDINRNNAISIGKIGDEILCYHNSNKEHYLEIFNQDMSRQATVMLDFLPSNLSNIYFYNNENKIIVIYQVTDGTQQISFLAFLNNKGLLLKTPTRINENRTGFFNKSDQFEFMFIHSEDKQHLVAYYIKKSNRKISGEAFFINVDLMNISKKVRINYSVNNTINFSKAQVSNKGIFFLPIYTSNKHGLVNQYTWLQLSANNPKLTVTHVPIGDYNFTNFVQTIDNKNEQIVFGSFFASTKNENIIGVLTGVYDIKNATFKPNSKVEFEDNMRGDISGKKKQKVFNNFKLNQLILQNDGSYTLVAEEQYTVTQNNFYPVGGLGYYSFYTPVIAPQVMNEYYFNDILALSINSFGRLSWYRFIHKNQYSQDDGGLLSSYFLTHQGKNIDILYNESTNKKNISLTLASLNSSGETNTNDLNINPSKPGQFITRWAKQIDENSFILPYIFKSQLSFVKVIL